MFPLFDGIELATKFLSITQSKPNVKSNLYFIAIEIDRITAKSHILFSVCTCLVSRRWKMDFCVRVCLIIGSLFSINRFGFLCFFFRPATHLRSGKDSKSILPTIMNRLMCACDIIYLQKALLSINFQSNNGTRVLPHQQITLG